MGLLNWTSRTPEFLHAVKALATTTPATLVTGTTIFRVNNGPIMVTSLNSYCITACDTTAATLQWSADGDVGAATTFTGASASLASMIAGSLINCNFVALTTAPIITQTAGVSLQGAGGIIIPAGIITTTVGSGPTTGTFLHYLRYAPMVPGATVVTA